MLENIKIGITHAGLFHADDVISTVFLKRMNHNIKIKRVFKVNQEEISNENIIVYDIGKGKFDHHQFDVAHDENDVPYCAFGLLWETYGREYLRSIGYKNIDKAFQEFKNDIVYKVNYGDNFGYKEVKGFAENYIIKSFYPKWFENQDEEAVNKQFNKAVEFIDMVWDNWFKEIYQSSELEEIQYNIWDEARKNIKNHAIYLDKSIPWERMLLAYPNENIHYVIVKSIRGGYVIRSIDEDKYKVEKNNNLSFVHNSGFMGVADSLEKANLAVQEFKYGGKNV